MFLVCSLRTNVVFVFIFIFLEIGVLLLAASYWHMAAGSDAVGEKLLKVSSCSYKAFLYL